LELPETPAKAGEYFTEWRGEFLLEIWQYFVDATKTLDSICLGIFPNVLYWWDDKLL